MSKIDYLPDNEPPPRESDKFAFLNLRLKPGKVDYTQAGYILDMKASAIRTLVTIGYLEPLGRAGKTDHKYFLTQEIIAYANNKKWMHGALYRLQDGWSDNNSRRKTANSEENKRRSPRAFRLGKACRNKSRRILPPARKANNEPQPPEDPGAL